MPPCPVRDKMLVVETWPRTVGTQQIAGHIAYLRHAGHFFVSFFYQHDVPTSQFYVHAEPDMNLPEDEEGFKQPKPPKSVFHVYEGDEPDTPWMRTDNGRLIAKPRKVIDISPGMYYSEKPPVR